MVLRASLQLAPVVLLCAVGCGASHRAAPAPPTKRCRDERAALARIQRDLVALRRAPNAAAVSTLTDRFLLHVDTAPISNLQRNRLIDHAAAAVASRCPQCFQALEADRPIPAIAHGDKGCG